MSSRAGQDGGGASRRGRDGRRSGQSPNRGRGGRGDGQSPNRGRGGRGNERSSRSGGNQARGRTRGRDRGSNLGDGGGSASGASRGRGVAAPSNAGNGRDTEMRADPPQMTILAREKGNEQTQDLESQPGSSGATRDSSQQASSSIPARKLPPVAEEYEKSPIGHVKDFPVERAVGTEQIENVKKLLGERTGELEHELRNLEPTTFATLRQQRSLERSQSRNRLTEHLSFLHQVCQSLQADVELSRPGEEELQERTAWLLEVVSHLDARFSISEKRRWMMQLDFTLAQIKAEEALKVAYPGGSLRLWENVVTGQRPNYTRPEQSKAVVEESVQIWFQVEGIFNVKINDLVESDLELYRRSCGAGQNRNEESNSDDLVQMFLANEEVAAFMAPDSKPSYGILVMGAPSEALPSVMLEVVKLLRQRPNTALLIHAAAQRNPMDSQTADTDPGQLSGAVGFLRSICGQLIHWCVVSELQMDWRKINEDRAMSRDSLRLCRSFRSVLLALALAAAANKTRYTVLVVVDNLHIIEKHEEFEFVVSFLRAVCNEAYFGYLGDALTFKYMFLHPSIISLLEMPHVAENLVLYPFRAFWKANKKASTETARIEPAVNELAVESSAPHQNTVKGKMKEAVSGPVIVRSPIYHDPFLEHLQNALENLAAPSFKAVGAVDGFPLGTIIEESQIEKAMKAVNNHILNLEKNLDATLGPSFEEIVEEFDKFQAKQSDRIKGLKGDLESVLHSELSRISANNSAATLKLKIGMSNAVKLFTARHDFALKRHWMIMIEFLPLRVDPFCPLSMEYPESNIRVWTPKENYEQWQLDVSYRRQPLDNCLTGPQSAAFAGKVSVLDFVYCLDTIPTIVPLERRLASRATYHLDNFELATFRSSKKSGGLLIQGCDLNRQLTPRVWSHTSHLFAKYIRSWASKKNANHPRAILLRHFAGFRNTTDQGAKKYMLSGVDGLMRSLCEQLIDREDLNLGLEFLGSLDEAYLARLQVGEVGAFCGLWRELLIDAMQAFHATDERQNVHFPRTIVVAIEGIEWFENNDSGPFAHVVDFFRALCEELNEARVLGRTVIFQYVLAHSGFSQLLAKPHALEQVAICPFDQVADRIEQAMPSGSGGGNATASSAS